MKNRMISGKVERENPPAFLESWPRGEAVPNACQAPPPIHAVGGQTDGPEFAASANSHEGLGPLAPLLPGAIHIPPRLPDSSEGLVPTYVTGLVP